jgi:hypothetical protein
LADPGRLPWIYPYREDPQSTRLGQPVFRPFVQISLAAADRSTPVLDGLIDTGADAILASDLPADQLDLDLKGNDGQTAHAVGGRTVTARYKTVELRLHSADLDCVAIPAVASPVRLHQRLAQLRLRVARKRGIPRSVDRDREPLRPSGRDRSPRRGRRTIRSPHRSLTRSE